MKAIIWTRYGSPDFLEYKEIDKPTPKDNELLIKVHAATAMPGDCEIRRFDMHVLFWLPLRLYFGLFKPKRPILGLELAGEIDSIGKNVENFKVGDKVFCGTGMGMGAYAEYASIRDSNPMAIKSDKVSFEEAATLPTGGTNALHYIRLANLKSGQKILINGAAGCFGTYAVQLASNLGAEVTAVDSTKKLDKLLPIGAKHVIDYTQEDYTKNGERYDVIFDIVGEGSVSRAMKSLTKDGRYILATPWVLQVLQGLWSSMISKKKFIFSLAKEGSEDLVYLNELIDDGKLVPVVDKSYPLEKMADAHKYVEKGEKIGHVVIKVSNEK